MKYTLVCFTFNKIQSEIPGNGDKLELHSHWTEEAVSDVALLAALTKLGVKESWRYLDGQKVRRVLDDFTLPNTRIIIHIIKNS